MLLRQVQPPIFSESVIFVSWEFFRREIGHILDDSQYRHVYPRLFEHRQPLIGIRQRYFLRRRNNNGARNGYGLNHRQVDVELVVRVEGREELGQHVQRRAVVHGLHEADQRRRCVRRDGGVNERRWASTTRRSEVRARGAVAQRGGGRAFRVWGAGLNGRGRSRGARFGS